MGLYLLSEYSIGYWFLSVAGMSSTNSHNDMLNQKTVSSFGVFVDKMHVSFIVIWPPIVTVVWLNKFQLNQKDWYVLQLRLKSCSKCIHSQLILN